THLFSLSSAAPIGVFTVYYLIVFVGARLLSYVIYADQWLSILAMTAAFALCARFVLPGVAFGFGHGWPVFSWENMDWGGLFFNTFFGLGIYWILSRLD